MPDLTRIIKNGFSRSSRGFKKTPRCPSELELGRYLDKSASASQKEEIERHLADCGYCLDLLVTAKEALKDFSKKPNMLYALKQQKWFILSMLSIGASFFIKRYFFQFLALSLIFGLKWALSAEGSRNLVMIFRNLSHKEARDEAKDKTFARR